MKRTLILTSALVAVAFGAQAQDKTVNLLSWGGAYGNSHIEAYAKPFEAKTGTKVSVADADNPATPLKAQVEAGNVTTDVASVEYADAVRLCDEGLLEELDASILLPAADGTAAADDFIPGAVTDCFVGTDVYSMILAYDDTKFADAKPAGPADFFDTAKFPGKRGLPGIASDIEPGILEGALVADGVARDKLYPLDVDKALKKLDTIRADAVFWDTGARAQQLIESGEVDMAWMWSGRALAGIKNGADFAANWNDFSPVFDTLVVPVGAKNPQASFALINYMIGKSAQEKLTEATSYSPIHDEAQPKVDELTQSFITTAKPKEQALPIDNAWWAENQADVITKWSDWLAG